MQMLHDENAPMIIASVDYLTPIYKSVSNYSNIVDFSIKGNREHESPVELHERAWYLMAPFFRKRQMEAEENFKEFLPQEKASHDLNKVVPASMQGRVETLFINKDVYDVWGFYKISDNTITLQEEPQPYSTCLFNAAAIQTFLQGGKVYNVSKEELPHPASDICAVFRY